MKPLVFVMSETELGALGPELQFSGIRRAKALHIGVAPLGLARREATGDERVADATRDLEAVETVDGEVRVVTHLNVGTVFLEAAIDLARGPVLTVALDEQIERNEEIVDGFVVLEVSAHVANDTSVCGTPQEPQSYLILIGMCLRILCESNASTRAGHRATISNQKSLQEVVHALATRFAVDLVEAIRNASVGEFMLLLGSGNPVATGSQKAAPKKRVRASWRRMRRFKSAAPRPKVTAKSLASAHKLQRRSKEEIGEMVEEIVSLVRSHSEGLTAEVIRGQLKVDRRELPIPLKLALESGKIRKLGHKRSTTYLAA